MGLAVGRLKSGLLSSVMDLIIASFLTDLDPSWGKPIILRFHFLLCFPDSSSSPLLSSAFGFSFPCILGDFKGFSLNH